MCSERRGSFTSTRDWWSEWMPDECERIKGNSCWPFTRKIHLWWLQLAGESDDSSSLKLLGIWTTTSIPHFKHVPIFFFLSFHKLHSLTQFRIQVAAASIIISFNAPFSHCIKITLILVFFLLLVSLGLEMSSWADCEKSKWISEN